MDRKTGCPLSLNFIIISSATLSHSPCGLLSRAEYHFFSDPGPRNDHLPGENLPAHIETRSALALHSCSLSSDPMRCRWTSTWRWSVLWNLLVLRSFSTWTLGLCGRAAMWWILGKYSTRIPLAYHQLCPMLCIVMNFWTTSTCPPRQYSIVGSRSSFLNITQNLKIRKSLRARDWWLLQHQSEINVSMENFPADLRLPKSHLIVPKSTFKISRTSAVKVIFSRYFWWNANCLSDSVPWIQMLPLSKT